MVGTVGNAVWVGAGTLTANATLHQDVVYHLQGILTVEQGYTLAIEPGTVVKGGSLLIRGSLNAAGTAARRHRHEHRLGDRPRAGFASAFCSPEASPPRQQGWLASDGTGTRVGAQHCRPSMAGEPRSSPDAAARLSSPKSARAQVPCAVEEAHGQTGRAPIPSAPTAATAARTCAAGLTRAILGRPSRRIGAPDVESGAWAPLPPPLRIIQHDPAGIKRDDLRQSDLRPSSARHISAADMESGAWARPASRPEH